MTTETAIENARLRIMGEMNKRFDEVLSELHQRGTEYSRRLATEIENDRERVTKELEDIWSYSKSKLISIEAGQKMFYEEILPKLLEKIDITVGMTRDAAGHAAQVVKTGITMEKEARRAEKAAHRAENALHAGNWQTAGIIIAISLAVLTGGFKLWQDWKNQNQTIAYLKALNSGVTINNQAEGAKTPGRGQHPEGKKTREVVIK